MARHGVPAPERRSHARTAAGARRRRAESRDAAQPWAAWLALRAFLALLVLAAAGWSVLLLTQSRGGIWPIIALAAGALSLAMIGLDVRARRRQRAAWRAHSAEPPAPAPTPPEPPQPPQRQPLQGIDPTLPITVDALGGVDVGADGTEARPPSGPIAEPPRRRSHRK